MNAAPMGLEHRESPSLKSLFDLTRSGNVPHVILLTGPVADIADLSEKLAKALLCRSVEPGERPCGSCDSCRLFDAGVHPDYLTVGVAGSGVKTGHIEELQQQLSLRSHMGGRIVYAIHGMDDATPVAANRLLKVLEEPVGDAVAILLASNQRRVLPTILSRSFVCQVLQTRWNRWDDDWMDAGDHAETESRAAAFAALSEPVIQWAKDLLSGSKPPLVLADSFLKICEGTDVFTALHVLSRWLRDAMHYRAGKTGYVLLSEREQDLREIRTTIDVPQYAEAIQLVVDAKSRLLSHVATNLNVEQMCIRLQGVLRDV